MVRYAAINIECVGEPIDAPYPLASCFLSSNLLLSILFQIFGVGKKINYSNPQFCLNVTSVQKLQNLLKYTRKLPTCSLLECRPFSMFVLCYYAVVSSALDFTRQYMTCPNLIMSEFHFLPPIYAFVTLITPYNVKPSRLPI